MREATLECESVGELLPVHGFVLAGGQSSRMRQDKALLLFRGTPMVALAVGKLRRFCTAASVVGNRDDLASFAPVVREARVETGPGAGIEAGLLAASQVWALFIPVDVPLVPARLLRRWAEAVLHTRDCSASYLVVNGCAQPAFCMVRQSAAAAITAALERGERRLGALLKSVEAGNEGGTLLRAEAASYISEQSREPQELDLWFSNVNTPAELAAVEAQARAVAEYE